MPFSVSGIQLRNRFIRRRKLSMATFASISAWPVDSKSTNNESLTNETYTENIFTAFGLNLEKPERKNQALSNTCFNQEAELAENVNLSDPLSQFNSEYPIIATHWGEFTDYELLNRLGSEEVKKLNLMDIKCNADIIEYKPFLWFN